MTDREPLAAPEGLAREVVAGLTRTPKSLPPHHFYDALGSALFEAITLLPEYYLTRTEHAILQEHVEEILDLVGAEVALVELGSGSGKKTRTIIRSLLARQGSVTYCPIDVSMAALRDAGLALRGEFPRLHYKPIADRYRGGLKRLERAGPRLVLFIGSSLGNYEPAHATRLLAAVAEHMGPEDALLLGTDMAKARRIVEPAYNDALGVTAAFNLNVLGRINRELGGRFVPGSFRHEAVYNEAEHRIEMYLVATTSQTVRIEGVDMDVAFDAGEQVLTEYSYKFTEEDLQKMWGEAGLRHVATWYDERRWFGLHLLRRPSES